jgi:hypothetical protein
VPTCHPVLHRRATGLGVRSTSHLARCFTGSTPILATTGLGLRIAPGLVEAWFIESRPGRL